MSKSESEVYTVYSVGEHLTHDDASRLSTLAESNPARMVVLDMTQTHNASTAAFARLVLLRRTLRLRGRDLQLAGMQGRPNQVFEVHRLENVLPRLASLPASALESCDRIEPVSSRVCRWQRRRDALAM